MKKITLPYHIARTTVLGNKNTLLAPINDNKTLYISTPAYLVAGAFANKFQEKLLDTGAYKAMLDYINTDGTFIKSNAKVQFKAKNKNLIFQNLTIDFQFFYQEKEQGFWAVVPVLGIEVLSETKEDLEKQVREGILLEFLRSKRLNILQRVLPTMWYEDTEIIREEVELTTYTLSELEKLKEHKQRELLPNIATKVVVQKQLLFGYKETLKQMKKASKGKFNKSILLVGPSGVGKTTLIWELARKKYRSAPIWETTAATLIKELSGQIGWQENLSQVCKELMERQEILFVRNFLELFEVGQYEGNSVSMGDFIREFLSRGEITLISECTEEEFAMIELRAPGYTSLFQVIRVEPPTDELEDIILKKVKSLAQQEEITISDDAIQETIRLNRRYTPYSGFPGKPIRFLESLLLNAKNLAIFSSGGDTIPTKIINRSIVLKAFCEETGMPPFMVDPAIPMELGKVRTFFAANLFGQGLAVQTVSNILASVKTALLRKEKPIASLLFVGPTGVGKTEMAKLLAEFMFGNRNKMIRFDMSEFSTPYSVSRLTGESYFSDGLLTSAVRREPFCVVLFDELEKADASFNDLLLQMLGEGRLTDSQGRLVDFCSTIIIMTSNIGAQRLQMGKIGWNPNEDSTIVTTHFEQEVRKFFRPEIYNRIDRIVPFQSLDKTVVKYVVNRELEQLKKREGIAHRNIEFRLEESIYDYIVEKGYHPKYGARAMQRALREQLIIPLSHELNKYAFDEKLVVDIAYKDAQTVINIEADPFKIELILEELTQNEYMDYASELRLKAARMKEGNYFIRLESEISMAEEEKRRNHKKFWDDYELSQQYTSFLVLREDYKKLTQEIERLEEEMALVSMQLRPLNTHLYEDIKGWEQLFFGFKVELYSALVPESRHTRLGIYGQHLKTFLKVYLHFIQEQGYSFQAETVWYRERLYNEMIEYKIKDLRQMGRSISEDEEKAMELDANATTTRQSKAYHYKTFVEKDEERWKKEEKGDILLGIELQIKGNGAQLFFAKEAGTHLWSHDEEDKKQCFIAVGDGTITPYEIHRKNFMQTRKKARRTYKPQNVEDTIYDMPKREIARTEQIAFVYKFIEKYFSARLDALLS